MGAGKKKTTINIDESLWREWSIFVVQKADSTREVSDEYRECLKGILCKNTKGASMTQKESHFSKREKVLGQFFTPPLVADFIVKFALKFLDRKERAIDPACGDGVFLSSLLDAGFSEVWGVDVDPGVVNLIPERVKRNVKLLITDALNRSSIPENYFDLVVGNPPFSAKYGRVSDSRLLQYELGRSRSSQAIEVLFLERFIQLARSGGLVGIILPEGVLASEVMKYVREFILRYKVLAVVSLPRGVFRSSLSTSSKTHILFLKKEPNDGGDALMIEINDLRELNTKGIKTKPSSNNLTPHYYAGIQLHFKLETKELRELVEEVKTGATEYGEKRVFSSKGLRYISAKTITPLGIDFSRDMKYIDPESPMNKLKAHVRPGDIVFVRVGVGCSGRTSVIIDENDVGVADDWIYIIRLKDREYLPYYLAIYMQSKPGKLQIERMKRGVGTVNIPKTELLKLKIPIPQEDVLKEIKNKYIEMVYKLRNKEKREAEKIFNNLVKLIEEIVLNT